MAQMFPKALPREILEDPKRSAEVLVYNAFSAQLSDKYHIFYSSPWLGTLPDGSEIDGEADFLVVHPEHGMLVIEVKGGRIAIDNDNNWTSTDRNGFEFNIKNPVNQARTSKHNLLKKFNKWSKNQTRWICAKHAVILPHVSRISKDLRPDMPVTMFAFSEDMRSLDEWVEHRFTLDIADSANHIQDLGDDGVAIFKEMLTKQISLRIQTGTYVHDDLRNMNLKTEEQVLILREIEENPKMTVVGAAGTGKTILAAEKALMMAEEGKRVLLLCYNRPLGLYLRRLLGDNPLITVSNFHQFCKDIAIKAGLDTSAMTFDDLAETIIDNFYKSGVGEFDGVIIDEGQDFHDEWLIALEMMVKNSAEGVFYIFFDDNQNVMSVSSGYISRLPISKYRLTRNFRNTEIIFQYTNRYYKGPFVKAIGPKGVPARFHTVTNTSNLKLQVAERIGSLSKSEGVDPEEIAVLFPSKADIDSLGEPPRFGGVRATDAENPKSDRVVVDTIRRFKGLEKPVILLVLTGLQREDEELLYTGLSRAQVLIEIFAPRYLIKSIQGF